VAHRTRQASTIYQNFVRENFTGGSCSDTYEVHGTSKLGKGSYGSVYLATHRITGDERAVKVMNVDRITSYYLRKLHTEIAILKSLDHPNIIKLQDVFFGKRSVYIVTDLCRGGELFELLNSGKNQGFVFREGKTAWASCCCFGVLRMTDLDAS
jgi:calcium-dependent protein kinase